MSNEINNSSEGASTTEPRRLLSSYHIGFGQLVSGILGVVIACVTLLYAMYIYPRHGLQVVTLTKSSLVNIASEIAGDIQVLYKGKPVPNLTLVETKLENTGNQPIRSSDFDRPLEFVFSDGADVVSAKVIDSRLVQFAPALTPISNTVQLQPQLLNPEARVILQFVVAGNDTSSPLTYTVKASIANILDTTPVDAVETGGARIAGRPAADFLTWLAIVMGAAAVVGITASLVWRQREDG